MKICYDTLDKLVYSKRTGRWYGNSGVTGYDYFEECQTCGEPFLSQRHQNGWYCSISCGLKKNKNGQSKSYSKTSYYDPVRNRERKAQYRLDWIRLLNEYRSMVCEVCGEDRFPCLDFHHKDPATKDKSATKLLSCKPTPEHVAKLFKELDKCQILCSNCHRVEHAGY